MTEPLSSDNPVARYCLASRLGKNNLPIPGAFEFRDGEKFLSSNWIEYFDMVDLESGMKKVRDEFGRHHSITSNGRFAVLNVGDAKKTVNSEYGIELEIEDLQEDDYPSHTGIWFPRDVSWDRNCVI